MWDPRGAEWTLSKTGKWTQLVFLLCSHAFCGACVQLAKSLHKCSCPRPGPWDSSSLLVSRDCNSVSPAAVPWTSPCCHTLVKNVKSHFLRALVEAGVQAEWDRVASCHRPEGCPCPLLSLPKPEPQTRWTVRTGHK